MILQHLFNIKAVDTVSLLKITPNDLLLYKVQPHFCVGIPLSRLWVWVGVIYRNAAAFT